MGAQYWQQWFDEGLVTFDVPEGPQPFKENEISSGDGTTNAQEQTPISNASVQEGDDYKGLQLPVPTKSPMKLVKGSPTRSIHSQYSGRLNVGSHISSVSSTSRRQYEGKIRKLEEASLTLRRQYEEKIRKLE